MCNPVDEEIIYKLTVEDIQRVSKRTLGRTLTKDEIASVGNSVGDFINWAEAIQHAIHACIHV